MEARKYCDRRSLSMFHKSSIRSDRKYYFTKLKTIKNYPTTPSSTPKSTPS